MGGQEARTRQPEGLLPRQVAATISARANPRSGSMAEEVAVLAGGCFWCTEAVFLDVVGVKSVESGYTGGTVPNPSYKQVCGGDTGHAEAIRITFDPDQLSFEDLLDIFFATHDPTQL